MANNTSSRQAGHAARYVVARVLRGLFWCLKYTVILPLATMALMALFVLWKDNTTPGKLLVKEINFVRQTAPAGQFPVSECWFSSSDSSGRSEIQDNLADWKVVLFMQGHCPYCHQFDPVLKQLAQQYGFSVFSYTLDGQGDTAFPEALPVPPEVMQTFFPNIPVATPTTFLVNVNTLEALPLLQGATDAARFMARVDTVLQMYGGKKGAK
ncbi:TPA: type-F conjugative transfer system pilin assembly thiol-disulfide isomerase TrbB [Escherichia coli]